MKNYLFLNLRDLPYFRALIRGVEASYYQDIDLPAPTYDIGCGDGHFASLTFARKIDVGLDPAHKLIHEANQYDAYRGLVEADGARSPFPNQHFASAISNSALEHISHLDDVLIETARVLKPDAPFYFCVPNSRYLSELSISRLLGSRYVEWFRHMSRVHHADKPDVWQERLEKAGFTLIQWWHYFSPKALRVLEWGHYFGVPSLAVHTLTGRWIIARNKWNLALTEFFIRKYASTEPVDNGTFTFYIARKK